MNISACRTIGWQSRQCHTSLSALNNIHRGGIASHVRFHPARMRRIYLYTGIAQLMCQMNGKGVERGFRSVISKRLHVVDWGAWIVMMCKRTHYAGQIHDAGCWGFAEQWEQRLRQHDRCEEVCVEGSLQRFRCDCAGTVVGPFAFDHNSGIVD